MIDSVLITNNNQTKTDDLSIGEPQKPQLDAETAVLINNKISSY